MVMFRYRALTGNGATVGGQIDALSRSDAVANLKKSDMRPIMVEEEAVVAGRRDHRSVDGRSRRLVNNFLTEIGVLLRSGLPLDRALAIAVDNVDQPHLKTRVGEVLAAVREGKPLSAALSAQNGLFPALAPAMSEAGEANGQLGQALERLAQMLEQTEQQRRQVASAMLYPIAMSIVAIGVMLLMLLFVVPQFEPLFATAPAGSLPPASVAVMAISRFVRDHGLVLLGGLAAIGFATRQALAQASTAQWLDRQVLDVPQIGSLIRNIETVRFSRSLGALLDGDVPLPVALELARRTISNRHVRKAIGDVTDQVRQGGGLSAPLLRTGALPTIAISFIRTGEESSELGPMLGRLATLLDRDIETRLERLIAVATPAIIVTLGVAVAGMVASIMSAILGFNDLAVTR
jgi:general secretion pathway protein F